MAVDPASPAESIHWLGHRACAVMLTAAGAGCSSWNGLAVSRWHAGQAGGEPGGYVYLRDRARETTWSATARPCGGAIRAWFDRGIARFARVDDALTTTLEVAVDPDRPVEIRGVGVRNDGPVARAIELTSYVELVLGPRAADDAHPAYSKMFVQTAIEDGVLLAWRRKKDPGEPDVWVAHALVVDGPESGPREWETDRARFIGRGGTLAAPAALAKGRALSNTVGTVLDPVFSLRARLAVGAGATRRAAFVTVAADSRDAVLERVHACLTGAACAEVFARAQAADRHMVRTSGIDAARARDYQRLAGALVRADSDLRVGQDAVARAEGGAPVLWAKGISGDLPIALAKVAGVASIGLVGDLVRAQGYWRDHGLPADVVVIDAAQGADAAPMAQALQELAAANPAGGKSQGSLFVLRAGDLDARLRRGLEAAARVVLDAGAGDLATQLARRTHAPPAAFAPTPGSRARGADPADAPSPAELEFWNGLGGFSADGREYVTILRDGAETPMPWSHVIANPDFGFLVTTTGGGYCWAVNSQQNQITPWSNDPVCDPSGEALLLRDREDGTEWSATASPRRAGGATYVARFGPGYARFGANVHGIDTDLVQCVAPGDPVKLSCLRLHNHGSRPRRIDVALTVAWSLGAIGSDPGPTTLVTSDPARAAVFACNRWRDGFAEATAFIACSHQAARVGSTPDGRSAVVATVDLAPGGDVELLFVLGEGRDGAGARALVDRFRATGFDSVMEATRALWEHVLGSLQVTTPLRSVDLLVNRCLPCQVLACRLWARTAFYQASGAYGFRDQLQDVGALCIPCPALAREHILRAAARQFEEGDVQHWWLPPSGKGVRTRIVDDRLWLPYTVAHYVATTGDATVLDERIRFLHADPLQPGQVDAFAQPAVSAESASLFEHCARALDASLARGVHGLPLIGTGDWNDGMNRVGAAGKGESVWMGWFLCRVISDFAPIADARDRARAIRWRDHARALQLALETKAWDGEWYRRAFYDDGTPLGSAIDRECRIESMAQSWAVISGAGDPERAARAMRAVNENLVRPGDGLVALFAEPFDLTTRDPGYIKGYPPGLRENGGQYTHGSIWSLIAFAMLGDGDKAGELLEIFDPIRKSGTPDRVSRYMVEPYVECADVYSVAPHVGRGGWTWYSGSAGWLYRAIVEWVLGFRLHGARLHLDPCIPRAWPGFALAYRHGGSTYRIEVANPGRVCRGVAKIEVDDVVLAEPDIELVDDGASHQVTVTLQEESDR